ncbi:MAG: phosphate/phosphite/phosphonate ABC transporter substrate-binding protein [Thiohalomonadales bacterium]
MINTFKKNLMLILLILTLTNTAYAQERLIFGTPPTQSPEITLANYQPLVDYLSKVIGRTIVVKPAKSFFEYSHNMRAGLYDIILDGPHFVKYRIEKMHHTVLVKQAGDLKFAVVVNTNSNINNYNDLVNKKVCAPASPNLATLTYLDLYKSPARQPTLIKIQGFKNAIKCVKTARSKAAIVPEKFWLKKVKNKIGLKVIYITKNKMPARGLTVNKDSISVLERKKLVAALTAKASRRLIKKAISTVGGSHFIKANQTEYTQIDSVLSQVWGFHI